MSAERDAVDRLVAQAEAQGLPRKVLDSVTLERVATIVRGALRDRRGQ